MNVMVLVLMVLVMINEKDMSVRLDTHLRVSCMSVADEAGASPCLFHVDLCPSSPFPADDGWSASRASTRLLF